MKAEFSTWIVIGSILLLGCAPEPETPASVGETPELNGEVKPASEATRAANAAVLGKLPFENTADFELANRGFIAGPDALVIDDAEGRRVWDMTVYDFICLLYTSPSPRD